MRKLAYEDPSRSTLQSHKRGWEEIRAGEDEISHFLEETLENFVGCSIVILHDRWFLDRIATHILAFEGDSPLRWFEGKWPDDEVDHPRRLGCQLIPRKESNIEVCYGDHFFISRCNNLAKV